MNTILETSYGRALIIQLQLDGFPEIITKEGSTIRYHLAPWNGVQFSGITYLKPNGIYTFRFVLNKREIYYRSKLLNSSIPSWIVFTDNELWHLVWIDRKQSWEDYAVVQMDDCDNYVLCGPYGICTFTYYPVCSCLKGFQPKSPNPWVRKLWSSGCVGNTPLICSNDGFLKYSRVKLPDSRRSWFSYSLNLEECKKYMCKNNCSCNAYDSEAR
ncbi:G-type lectin S-receptor-like serine/threonine-protein kinase [Gossypium australe]|uniref:G-type lectin S-receptor-like serine/threonine-protein kinase n=1 Tax=Gossypium australe TaxID=47621 RepID=A0A5B6VU86_9ROSI|nr:G-type lectin S-receptor-like serine/threonine-protein kinase [Gossypium australe]